MRLKVLSNYFQAYRIDHILGFFRIWQISRSSGIGNLGKFYPAIPLSAKEFEEKGIWDFQRLIQPYTTWENLVAGHEGDEDKCHQLVKKYFDEVSFLRYTLKPHLNNLQKLSEELKKNNEEDSTKEMMRKVLGSVILIEDEQPNHYHFRVEMHKTISFQALENDAWKNTLETLYYHYFNNLQDSLWRQCGLQRLPVMRDSTKMLVCGEDLGTVPQCVGGVLEELSILGLRIQRFPKVNERIENPLNYPYYTVDSPSCHDISTIRGWWKEDREGAKYLAQTLGIEGEIPEECEPEIVEKILGSHIAGGAMLVIIAIQDYLALDNESKVIDAKDERINKPCDGYNNKNWIYRIPFTLEKLSSSQNWLNKLSNLIRSNSRD